MNQKTCTYCKQEFHPSHYHPDQKICSSVDCQRRRRSDYHRRKISTDPGYRDQCRDSQKKWRQNNPGYMSRYVAERKSRERSAPERARLLSELRRLETLDKGRLGEQASTLGSLLLTKLKNALFARKRRQLFTLYCDEIQNLVAYDSGLDTLLSEARKFGICIVSANQFLEQYPAQMRAAIMAVGTH